MKPREKRASSPRYGNVPNLDKYINFDHSAHPGKRAAVTNRGGVQRTFRNLVEARAYVNQHKRWLRLRNAPPTVPTIMPEEPKEAPAATAPGMLDVDAEIRELEIKITVLKEIKALQEQLAQLLSTYTEQKEQKG